MVHAKVLEADGRSRGMGVVEYASRSDAAAAIRALDGSELDGRVLGCREDREFEERAGGGGGFGGGGGGRDRDRDRDDRLPDRAPPPRLGAGGGGGADTCYTCGGVGHRSRDCPSEPGVLASRGGGSGFGGGSRGAPAAASADGCRLCGEVGHYARECPNGGRGGGGRGGGGGASDGGGCRICGVVGHFARECPTAGGSRGGGGGRGGGRGGDRRQIDPAKLDADMARRAVLVPAQNLPNSRFALPLPPVPAQDDYFKSREGK